jgi:hypothetical protein
MDCGAGLLTGLHRGILDGAHRSGAGDSGTVDGALSARGAIDWFRENGLEALLSRTVVVLVSHTPHEDADIENARRLLSDLPVFPPAVRPASVGRERDRPGDAQRERALGRRPDLRGGLQPLRPRLTVVSATDSLETVLAEAAQELLVALPSLGRAGRR